MAEKSDNPKIDLSILIEPHICQKIKDSLRMMLETVKWYGDLLDKVASDDEMRRVWKVHRGVLKLMEQLTGERMYEHQAIDDEEPTYIIKNELLRAETLATVYRLAKDLHTVLKRILRCLEN